MVHNGIEYGIMQLIAESYDLMKRGLGLTEPELYEEATTVGLETELNSYLLEHGPLFLNSVTSRRTLVGSMKFWMPPNRRARVDRTGCHDVGGACAND
ncbi:MAG: hypothetical protein R2867_42840 [Caldilineaceae bacterium]